MRIFFCFFDLKQQYLLTTAVICINSIPKDELTVVFASSTGLTKRERLSKTFSTSCFELIFDVSPIQKGKQKMLENWRR